MLKNIDEHEAINDGESSSNSMPTTGGEALGLGPIIHTTTTEVVPGTVSSAYDPYYSPAVNSRNDRIVTNKSNSSNRTASLLDCDEDPLTQAAAAAVGDNFLEMELESPGRSTTTKRTVSEAAASSYRELNGDDAIRTNSGLLLTHRRTPVVKNRVEPQRDRQPIIYDEEKIHGSHGTFAGLTGGFSQGLQVERERLEVDYPRAYRGGARGESYSLGGMGGGGGGIPSTTFLRQTKRILSYARWQIKVTAAVLVFGTIVLMHHARHEGSSIVDSSGNDVPVEGYYHAEDGAAVPAFSDRVILMPIENMEDSSAAAAASAHSRLHTDSRHRALTELRQEFDNWVFQHKKVYHSDEERENRFGIWSENHHRTLEKNRRHGPCKLTGKPVFGSNHLKDLTQEEFQQTYLTGYNTDRSKAKKNDYVEKDIPVLGPHIPTNFHPEVERKLKTVWLEQDQQPKAKTPYTSYQSSCDWYDMTCILRYIYSNYLYGLGGTMEPAYDSDSFPTAIDWRDYGAVTDVRSQGNCGACWAITAVETIESAVFLSYGNLYTLAETEVIICAEDCQMCYGGWPQNAFEYVMEQGGLPLQSDMYYDGDYLLELSESYAYESGSGSGSGDGNNDETYGYCPNGHGSNDNGDDVTRYGSIKGYGYATSKCVCYTDGTGCDCDSQNEGLAVRNLATYGPAVVCLDASTWADYEGGIMTADSGCSSSFLDVNHCVQAVGYAFFDSNDDGEQEERSGSGDSRNSGSGSRDSGDREGYWIVRNQWSDYWGMAGYAYVSMGENTCGILNDMLQAYT